MQISLCIVKKYAKGAVYHFGTIANFLNPPTSLRHVEENPVSPMAVAGREAEAKPIRFDPRPLRGLAMLGMGEIRHSARL